MKLQTIFILITVLTFCAVFTPQTGYCQNTSTQEQLDHLKQEYEKGTITLKQYQEKSNALITSSTTILMTTTPGDHFKKAGRCFIAGGVLFIAGSAIAGTSPLWPVDGLFIAAASVGGGLGLIGLICDIAGGAQLIKGGKQLNALKIGQTASLEITPLPTGAAFALKF